jgi:large subunit ribosomal protein L25
MLNSVTVKCRPAEIPEFLEIDVTDMEMSTNLFVKDITLPSDVEMITAQDIAVVSVQEPKQESEETDDAIEDIDSGAEDTEDNVAADSEASTSEDTEESSDKSGEEG